MKKMINKTHIEGRVYESELVLRVSKKGVPFISGKLNVVTDEAGLNVIPVDFVYVTEKTSKGAENKTWGILAPFAQELDENKKVIKERTGKTVMSDGFEAAQMVRIDSALGLNEFYREEGGEEKLVSAKRNEGGFVHLTNTLADEDKRNTFEVDMVITSTSLLEGDEEKGTQDKLRVRGAIFNFAGKLMPVEFSVTNPKGIEYFEKKIDASAKEPFCVKVWGKQINETIVNKKVTESAFGEAMVTESKFERKDWVMTGMSNVPYDFDDESFITAKELQEAMANREIYLAEVKQRQDEYKAQKENNSNAFNTATAPAAGGFNF